MSRAPSETVEKKPLRCQSVCSRTLSEHPMFRAKDAMLRFGPWSRRRTVWPLGFVLLLAGFNSHCADAQTNDSTSAETACRASCEHQLRQCPSIDIEGCFALCSCVVSTITESQTCLTLAEEMWACDIESSWSCADNTSIVGIRDDRSRCQSRQDAFVSAGCQRPCG